MQKSLELKEKTLKWKAPKRGGRGGELKKFLGKKKVFLPMYRN